MQVNQQEQTQPNKVIFRHIIIIIKNGKIYIRPVICIFWDKEDSVTVKNGAKW